MLPGMFFYGSIWIEGASLIKRFFDFRWEKVWGVSFIAYVLLKKTANLKGSRDKSHCFICIFIMLYIIENGRLRLENLKQLVKNGIHKITRVVMRLHRARRPPVPIKNTTVASI